VDFIGMNLADVGGIGVVDSGGMMTMDHNPDRLNIHVDKDGTVKNVTHG
jgi:hypothetical protein